MFGLFSSKSQDKVVDGIYSGLDKLVLTDEERLDFENKKAELKKSFLPLFEPYKKAQRLIAVFFSVNFVLLVWVGVAIYWFKPERLDGYIALMATFNIGLIMLAIIGWYFTDGTGIFKGKK